MKKTKHIFFYLSISFLLFGCNNTEEMKQTADKKLTNSAAIVDLFSKPTPNTDSNSDFGIEIDVAGYPKKRTFSVYLPKGFNRAKSYATIILLHGFTGDGGTIADRMKTGTYRRNYILVAPNGSDSSWNAGKCCGTAQRENIDDVKFIENIVSRLHSSTWINRSKLYIAGFSNGGMMAFKMACRFNYFDAMAAVSGSMAFPNTECDTSKKIPIIYIHNKKDWIVPFKGRLLDKGYTNVKDNIDYLVNKYGLKGYRLENLGGGNYTIENYYNYKQDYSKVDPVISFYTMNYYQRSLGKRGHFWPESSTYEKVDATTRILDFFDMNQRY